MRHPRLLSLSLFLLVGLLPTHAAGKRKVIITQDAAGPAGSNLQSIALVIQQPDVEVLGIVVDSGDDWRDRNLRYTLRMLEMMKRTDIPVLAGSSYPLINTQAELNLHEKLQGKVPWKGAWNEKNPGPHDVPTLPEGNPQLKPSPENATAFLTRTVHQSPGEVTVIVLGPMTDVALACATDPEFSKSVKELVFMGANFGQASETPGLTFYPRQEFNFLWDPEAARIVLRSPWKHVVCLPTDATVGITMTPALESSMLAAKTSVGHYFIQYPTPEKNMPLWDEIAVGVWIDPSMVTQAMDCFMDAEVDHGAGYGTSLSWPKGSAPGLGESLTHVVMKIDKDRFVQKFLQWITAPTPTK
jgi:inosine-uridine nucleoside N-ribohydrolase